jgi:uncharacterized protein YjiK
MLFREVMQVKKIIFCILSLAAISTFLHLTGLDDRFFWAVISLKYMERSGRQEIWLNDYFLAKSQIISCLEDEVSGITYSNQTKTLFIITDDPPKVYNIDKSGRCLR